MSEDIAKYELFLERNKPVIHHVSLYYARGNSDCFNDLMQEIAIVLWKEFKRYGWLRISDPVAEKAWTFRVANRAALRYMKKNAELRFAAVAGDFYRDHSENLSV